MLLMALVLGAVTFAETKPLVVQIGLDRAGYSCNTLDGSWGGKSERAAQAYVRNTGSVPKPTGSVPSASPEIIYQNHFKNIGNPYRWEVVTAEDFKALVRIPNDPAGKAELETMGYESIKEMFAERGHLSQRAIERLNPRIDWLNVKVGDRIRIPDFPSMDEEFNVWPKNRPGAPRRPEAALIRISLSRFEISAYDKDGKQLAHFPCSIAKNKKKLPPHGELRITETVARPNYTYTPDHTPAGKKARRYIFPPGPNCPVGVAWLGLNLQGYGIHGTPNPESIGNAESHGCFRLSNWNAARLYGLCRQGTRVIIED